MNMLDFVVCAWTCSSYCFAKVAGFRDWVHPFWFQSAFHENTRAFIVDEDRRIGIFLFSIEMCLDTADSTIYISARIYSDPFSIWMYFSRIFSPPCAHNDFHSEAMIFLHQSRRKYVFNLWHFWKEFQLHGTHTHTLTAPTDFLFANSNKHMQT